MFIDNLGQTIFNDYFHNTFLFSPMRFCHLPNHTLFGYYSTLKHENNLFNASIFSTEILIPYDIQFPLSSLFLHFYYTYSSLSSAKNKTNKSKKEPSTISRSLKLCLSITTDISFPYTLSCQNLIFIQDQS